MPQVKGIVDEIEGGDRAEGQPSPRRGLHHPVNPLAGVEPADVRRQIAILSGITSASDRKSTCTLGTEEKEVSSTRSSKRETPKNCRGADMGKSSKAKGKRL